MPGNPLQPPLMLIMRTIVATKPLLIDAMGAAAVEFIDDNFAKQGFQGKTLVPWKKLKKTPKGKQRKILVDTATLRRSFKQTNSTDHTTISTDVPYAQAHNEGMDIQHPSRSVILSFRRGKGGKLKLGRTRTAAQKQQIVAQNRATVGAYSVTMPQRQFMGDSPVLRTMCEKAILKILIAKLPS
jgi:phage gpG-like protein